MVLGLSKQPNWLSTIHLENYLNRNLPTDFTEEPKLSMVSPECSSILHDENEKSMYNEERLIELSMVSLEFGTACQGVPPLT